VNAETRFRIELPRIAGTGNFPFTLLFESRSGSVYRIQCAGAEHESGNSDLRVTASVGFDRSFPSRMARNLKLVSLSPEVTFVTSILSCDIIGGKYLIPLRDGISEGKRPPLPIPLSLAVLMTTREAAKVTDTGGFNPGWLRCAPPRSGTDAAGLRTMTVIESEAPQSVCSRVHSTGHTPEH
jgi:hypothetical protein